MKREDLRSKIIPTTIGNTQRDFSYMGNPDFYTTDLIYLDDYIEQFAGIQTDNDRRISATDYAQMNHAKVYDGYTTRTGRPTTKVMLRSADVPDGYNFARYVHYVSEHGRLYHYSPDKMIGGLCPSLHYHLPSEELEQFDIREVTDLYRKHYISYTTNL